MEEGIALVWHLAQRDAALEYLVEVVRLVVSHVFDLEVDVVVRELGVRALPMPLGRS